MSLRHCARWIVGLLIVVSWGQGAGAETPAEPTPLAWHDDYQVAWKQASRQHKMLLLYFYDRQATATRTTVDQMIANDAALRQKLSRYVLAKLPSDVQIRVDGKPVTLLHDPSLAEMHRREGIAIIDLKHQGESYYGLVVSAYPFMSSKYYSFRPQYLGSILDLPKGTITQRTMIWAVRVHPERPASTSGTNDANLRNEAESHSRYQAQLGVQGHHQWGSRFQRILRLLGGRRAPVEVVAESWPNQTMIDSCVDCVDSWRHSSGHWNAVKSYQASYGYDIKRGSNGIWYGTGILAR